jgi:glycosyltransferase involved in cell wall biosynthesis
LSKTPSVSAIIPAHNAERFIAEAVTSVLEQTRPPDECIVVDDGSTDGTIEALEPFGRSVRLVRQPQAGVSAARNAGMRAATGDRFAFLDADDVWLPPKLERQQGAIAGLGPHAATYTAYVIADRNLRGRRTVVHPVTNGAQVVLRTLLVEGPGLGFSFTAVVTRSAAERAGGFREHLSISADIDFAWRLSRFCPMVGVAEPLAIHRQHAPDQMHRDVERAEQELSMVIRDAEGDGLSARLGTRGQVNIRIHSAAIRMLRGDVGRGAIELLDVGAEHPRRTARLLACAAAGRAVQRARTWSARGRGG